MRSYKLNSNLTNAELASEFGHNAKVYRREDKRAIVARSVKVGLTKFTQPHTRKEVWIYFPCWRGPFGRAELLAETNYPL